MSDRKPNGQFGKGNPGGPGRPSRAAEADYLRTMADAVPVEQWRRIVARAASDAEKGDARARDWLGRYLLGATDTPAASIDSPVRFYLPENGRSGAG